MLEAVAAITAKVMTALGPFLLGMVQLFGTGILLGLGFWVAKQITAKIEVWLALRDEALMSELEATAPI